MQTNWAPTPNARRNGFSTRSPTGWTSAIGRCASRTAGDGLIEAVEEIGADVLVVGSSSDGAHGQVVLGSTTDWLLHASPVPVAISPRGYRAARGGKLTRITCAYSGTPESVRVVERVAALTAQLDVAMRVVSFAIRGRTMFPPLVGLQTEDSLLDAWADQMREMSAKLKADGVVGDDVALEVVTGNGWDQALDATEWEDGDLLALGTSSRRSIKGVFLGSHGAKIIRFSPVPVLVLPERSTSRCRGRRRSANPRWSPTRRRPARPPRRRPPRAS